MLYIKIRIFNKYLHNLLQNMYYLTLVKHTSVSGIIVQETRHRKGKIIVFSFCYSWTPINPIPLDIFRSR